MAAREAVLTPSANTDATAACTLVASPLHSRAASFAPSSRVSDRVRTVASNPPQVPRVYVRRSWFSCGCIGARSLRAKLVF